MNAASLNVRSDAGSWVISRLATGLISGDDIEISRLLSENGKPYKRRRKWQK